MCNNPKLDLVNMNEYINLVKFYQLAVKLLSGNEKIMTNEQTDERTGRWNDRQSKSYIVPLSY